MIGSHGFPTLRRALRRLSQIGTLLLIVTSAMSCRDESVRPLNVLVIMLDTVRADHLGAWGYGRATSPNLDAFAEEAVLFERNWAQAPCTYPSVNSLLTSHYASRFASGATTRDLGIPPEVPTLAEMLKARGYATYAISASPIVRATPSANNPKGGFGEGFEFYDETCLWNNVDCVNSFATTVLDQFSTDPAKRRVHRPFLLYLHYMDAHDPYEIPETATPRFSGEYAGASLWAANGDPNPLSQMIYGGGEPVTFDESDIAYLELRYDDDLAYLDEGLGDLFDHLRDGGFFEETLVIVLADHGESFMEHGHIKHCYNLYQHNLHTPLIVRHPGGAFSARVTEQTSNLDVVPTILDMVDERLPTETVVRAAPLSRAVRGRSLAPYITGRTAAGTQADGNLSFANIDRHHAVTDGRFKLIHNFRTGEIQAFDIRIDPKEQSNLGDLDRPELRRLRRELYLFMAGESRNGSDETQEKLRSLEYLH